MTRHAAHPAILVTLTLVLAACAAASEAPSPPASAEVDSIAGTYDCLQPGASEADVVVLAADGTLTITHSDGFTEPSGVWSVDGTEGRFGTEAEGESFSVEGENLVFGDGTVCTPSS